MTLWEALRETPLWEAVPASRPVTGGVRPWTAPAHDAPVPPLEGVRFELGDFSRALRQADILDLKAVELPGAYVLLPYGVRLMRHYRALVREAYERAGLVEYEYPALAAPAHLEPLGQVFPLQGRLLFAWAEGDERPRAVLTPSGEAAIYSHWARLPPVETPLELYRCATYFRPAGMGHHSGRGVFRSIETPDTFEFHATYPDRAQQQRRLVELFHLLRSLLETFHLPALWSTRPGATNHGSLFESSIAADIPTPLRATVFCGALYDQGQRLSAAYGIKSLHGRTPAHQLCGAVSRRLVFCHLLLGMNADGTFLTHPDISADQVVFVAADERSVEPAHRLREASATAGLRARVEAVSSGQLRPTLDSLLRRGVPLSAVIQTRGDSTQLRLRRADTRETLTGISTAGDEILPLLSETLADIGRSYDARVRRFKNEQLREVEREPEIREALTARKVALIRTEAPEAMVAAVAGWRLGEVLGVRPRSSAGEPYHAIASPRL